jgi:SAM-dependent methyltransferase
MQPQQIPVQAERRIVTGGEYVAQLDLLESDRRARAAFRQLVLEIARPGASLLDFGCGPGLDACFYAEHDFAVRAYDVDPQMCEYFRVNCRALLAAGRMRLEEGRYQEFLARHRYGTGSVDLVTSNFAPLNLIDDLHELFATLHALTAPDGRILASVLSPYFLGDLRYRWWWRNLPRLVHSGRYAVPGAQAAIVRRCLADFVTQSAPYFTLEAVFRGLPGPHLRRPVRTTRHLPGRATWLGLSTCRYMFLLFARREAAELSGEALQRR